MGILCMVENPRNSRFWFVTPWVEMQVFDKLYFQDHQACMYGSRRPKYTRLCANFEQVCTISALCDGQHQHDAWGIVRQGNKRTFATSLEVHYPPALCQAITRAFMLRFAELVMTLNQVETALHHAAKALTNQQAVSMKIPPLVPVHKHRYVMFFMDNSIVWPAVSPPSSDHKVLHRLQFGEVVSVENKDNVKKRILDELRVWGVDFSWDSFSNFSGGFDEMKVYAVPWEPDEFLG